MIQNIPDLWRDHLPRKEGDRHKYDYGHACIYAAPDLTGATRLAAEACARSGAGLVTVVSAPARADVYRASLPAYVLVHDDPAWFSERVSAVLYGSGGLSQPVRIRPNMKTVLDADALANLPGDLNENVVLTPHEGEFARTFPDLKGSRAARALAAAQQSGAVVVLKGAETIIAHPDGRVVVNAHASPVLASAGTGDVLAGLITGLLAQGMPVFEAACAAVWIHGEAARRFGPGLVASDLPAMIPAVLQDLLGFSADMG